MSGHLQFGCDEDLRNVSWQVYLAPLATPVPADCSKAVASFNFTGPQALNRNTTTDVLWTATIPAKANLTGTYLLGVTWDSERRADGEDWHPVSCRGADTWASSSAYPTLTVSATKTDATPLPIGLALVALVVAAGAFRRNQQR